MRLVGYYKEIYCDARSHECKGFFPVCNHTQLKLRFHSGEN